MKIPAFQNKEDLFKFLVENQDRILADKRASVKYADAFTFGAFSVSRDGETDKANKPVTEDVDELKVKAVINTTNLMDSHDDVHIPGLWTKSLKENKDIYHDQEHRGEFASTISDYEDLKAYTESYTWKDLGHKFEGETQALIFESTVRKDRNEFMFQQYKKGRVKQHSVGMRYVKVAMAVNDKAWPDEYKTWNKYIDQVANREDAEKQGYFFAVTEAKVIEGSAVKRGSNWATPTLENNMKHEPEPEQSTPQEPPVSTPKHMTSEEIINTIKNHFK